MTTEGVREGARAAVPGPGPAGAGDMESWFAALPPVSIPDMIGLWHGAELPSGHPLDGILSLYGWVGKEFIDADRVHPLLFRDGQGRLLAVEPRLRGVMAMPLLRCSEGA